MTSVVQADSKKYYFIARKLCLLLAIIRGKFDTEYTEFRELAVTLPSDHHYTDKFVTPFLCRC
jgi:hypothetical protein